MLRLENDIDTSDCDAEEREWMVTSTKEEEEEVQEGRCKLNVSE